MDNTLFLPQPSSTAKQNITVTIAKRHLFLMTKKWVFPQRWCASLRLIRYLVFLASLLLSPLALANSFYVVYEWQQPEGGLTKSWATGTIKEDIDTEKGMHSLIDYLKKERNTTNLVILYVKKLKQDPNQPANATDIKPKQWVI